MSSPLREILARFGIEVDTKALEKGDKGVDSLTNKLASFGQAVAAVFVVQGLAEFVSSTVEEARALAEASVKAGLAEQEYQALAHAANMLDVSQQSLGTGLKFLQKNLYDAANGGKESRKVFDDLGIAFKDGVTPSTVETLTAVSDQIMGMKDPAEQTAIALKVFGRGGQEMLPMLKKGGKAIEEYAKQIDELGGGFSPEFMGLTDTYEEQRKELDMLWRSMRSQILTVALPVIMRAAEGAKALGKAFLQLNKDGAVFRTGLIAGLVAISAVLNPLLVKLFALALPLLGLIAISLVLEDIVGWLSGSDSVIGAFFDTLDTRITESAVIVGAGFATMFSSWDNFVAGLAAANVTLGFILGMPFIELANLCATIFAKIADGWALLLSKLHLPPAIEKALNFGGGTSEGGASAAADEANAKSRLDWAQTYEQDPAIVKFKAAMADRQQQKEAEATTAGAKAWEAGGGRMGTSAPADQGYYGAIPEVTITGKAPAAGSNITVNDNSKPVVNVTVPEGTPAAVGKAVGKASSEALAQKLRNQYGTPVGFESEA
jgi:hypothetical protein